MNNIFEKLTLHSRNALKNAFALTSTLGHKSVTPFHILYGLSRQKGSIAAGILMKAKITEEDFRRLANATLPVRQTVTQIGLALNTKKIMEKSFLLASLNRHQYVGTQHLLASVLAVEDSLIKTLFTEKNIDSEEMKKQVEMILNSTSKFPDLVEGLDSLANNQAPGILNPTTGFSAQKQFLELFAVNLTDSENQKRIDPLIGRTTEIERLIEILCRRQKNNPLLLGEAGVGKTAIVEGLAKKISLGQVPSVLKDKKIYSLDLSLIVAGTSFRGEFENRLKQIIHEVKKDPNIILFIDEIHNIIGAGSAAGSMDAANILKPALARGEIRCIGATTFNEYKKHIENDPALERRFQTIIIDQPNLEKTIEILRGIKSNYENFHQIKISDSAILASATLADRYLADRFLPDKAIDLLDEAGASLKIKNLATARGQEINDLQNRLKEITAKKQTDVINEKFDSALKYKNQEQEILVRLNEIKQKNQKNETKFFGTLTAKEVADVIAKTTGIPPADLVLEEKKQLLDLEKKLAKKIIGQTEAIGALAEFIRRSRTGITPPNRPIGSFIFLGPSGVGKTELAKVLAQAVFGQSQALVRIDMSEFAESFNVSKLIGAPAGYVGYKEGAKLTDAVKHRPYAVVLFDEIEKAHSQVFNLLLQILEDGRLTDGTGRTVNFKNTIIIMTSNLGSESFNQQAAIGFAANGKKNATEKSFAEIKDQVLKKLNEKFPPEFLSRIDKTLVFSPLDLKTLTAIARLQIEELANRLKPQKINLKSQSSVFKLIAQKSFYPQTGARAIRQTIQTEIENQIANLILKDKTKDRKNIELKTKNNTIII
jgi:ATP-dependent Clp protease ATP-binding subunit ClpC